MSDTGAPGTGLATTPTLGRPTTDAVGMATRTPDMGDGRRRSGGAGARTDAPGPNRTTDGAGATTVEPALLSYQDFRVRPHGCFACGELNEAGLHLGLNLEPGRCWVELEVPRRFEGWEGIVHGGILCTIMDEVMAWALVQADNWGVTARMSVDFRKPVTVGRRIRAEGWITESRRRIHTTAGRMLDLETGVELVRAEATYLGASGDRKRELKERYGISERADQ
jgi:acyl-coenzyme A thioesterase PaaI-like protein